MNSPDRRKRDRVDTDDGIAAPGDSKRRRLDYEDHDEHLGRIRERSLRRLSHVDYTVGWICALHIEMAAAEAMLDNIHASLPKDPNDSNTYTVGNIGHHNIVIASLPVNGYGTNNAATVANNMDRTFPSIRVRLMVGIGGGVPGKADVRLGDVVVSTEVVQYDMGKTVRDGLLHRTGIPRRPPPAVMTAVAKLRANHESKHSKIPSILSETFQRNPLMSQYARPSSLPDQLFDSGYDHVGSMDSCVGCEKSKLLERSPRSNETPKIHYGVVASGNQVMKHAKTRDRLARELDIICFEMEAAGLMDGFPCLVIRGICDYSDSHKNKRWQEYAAATAAAYAKELLSIIHPNETQTRSTVTTPSITGQALQDQRKALLDSLRFEQIDSRQVNIKAAHKKTCEWLLQHPDYVDWLDPTKFSQHNGFLWIKGKPGAGKSTLMKFAYSQAKKKTFQNGVIASFFFNARGDELEKSTAGMYRSLLLRLLERLPDLQEVLDIPDLVLRHQGPSFTWETQMLCNLFVEAIKRLGQRPLTCFIDALDECGEDQVRAMIEDFENLGQHSCETGTKLSICFSSRHYPHIDIQHGRQLILEDQVGHGQDLEKYVRNKLRAGTGEFVEDIRTEILQKAAGVFMWAVLVVAILNEEFSNGRIFAVKKRLQEIPAELSALFKNILTKDKKNMADLLLCIQWILYAKRPLKREEFYFAVVSGLEPEQAMVEWNPKYITTDAMNLFVLSSSKGLAEITRSKDHTVQFIHESALLQLEHSPSKDGMTARLEYGRDFAAHRGQTPLSWAAEEGHREIVQLLLDKGAEIDAKDNDGRTPLWWAARNGHKEIVLLLLEKGAEIDAKGNISRTPLSWAAGKGHKEIVQLLLDKGAEIDSKNINGWTPLSWAAANGHKEIVQLLLDKGARYG
ncbi:hypothetical protein DL768_010725 [Monosporascus sp. mg162]|nr:hypothetical protein DL768_010725 [Monosporascus sp. mg162]